MDVKHHVYLLLPHRTQELCESYAFPAFPVIQSLLFLSYTVPAFPVITGTSLYFGLCQEYRSYLIAKVALAIICNFACLWVLIVQELCESRGGRPGLSVLTSLLVSVDVKIY